MPIVYNAQNVNSVELFMQRLPNGNLLITLSSNELSINQDFDLDMYEQKQLSQFLNINNE